MKTNEKQNVDLLGNKWGLAPGGRRRLDTCRQRLWNYQNELKSYSALLKNIGDCEIQGEDLHGLGISLERIERRLKKLSDNISKVVEQQQ